mmetsp:Transcript_175883/g.563904  ORF Transcript_175883/g.563904 Transcript_175883/m.563904 type:complete len:80 (-) Transcript_175883:318-557(-)
MRAIRAAAALLLLLGGAQALQLGDSPKPQPTKQGVVSIADAAPLQGAIKLVAKPPAAVESAIPQPEAKGKTTVVAPSKR